jgi:hypothetical protein
MTKITNRSDNYDIGVNLKAALNKVHHETIENIDIAEINESSSDKQDYNVYYLEIGGRIFYYYSMFKVGLAAGYGLELANKFNISFGGPRLSLLIGFRFRI